MRRQNSGSSSSSPGSRRKRLTAAATAIPLAIGLASTQLPIRATAPGEGVFAPACTVPFVSLEQHHPIDDSCGVDGRASADTPQSAQNEAKNNFCAAGDPVNVNFDVLRQLQEVAASRVTFGSDRSLPSDRSQLLNLPTTAGSLGEGTVVRVAAFIMDAHPSNATSGGESVNCKTNGTENNDIHIVLAESSDETDQCNSATAEMSPHLRPDLWNPDVLNERDTSIFPDGGPKHMFRFTGQLFFDASHKPCTNGRGSPKRSTIWEIHPVYAVEICIDPNMQCTVDNDANWQQLIDFAAGAGNETRLHWPDTGTQPQKSSHRRASDPPATLTGFL